MVSPRDLQAICRGWSSGRLKIGQNYVETTIKIRIQIAWRMAATKIGSGGGFRYDIGKFWNIVSGRSCLEDRIACTAP
jgi:hypothetical protein